MFIIFIACLRVPMLSIPFFMHVFRFRFIDIHVFTWSRIYCHLCYLSLHVPVCLSHLTWSCTRVPVTHAIWLYPMYSLGLLTTLDSHVQILEPGPWRICCSIRVHSRAWISGCLSGPSSSQSPLDRLARFSSCYSWVLSRISYCTSCFCAS